jgi:predicted enzyme related to lactoylglutathione lyase
MPARINHLAIISHQYAMLGRFYGALFGMQPATDSPLNASISYGDGNIGMQMLVRRDGYIGGIDHFGMLVDDLGEVERRVQRYAGSSMVQRPSSRPFAAYSANDPDGNHFDLAQAEGDTRQEIYAKGMWEQSRTINKFAIRTPNAARVADFYAEVFDLTPLPNAREDGAHYLSDGRVTLAVQPWSMEMFSGMAIKRPGPEHIGFKVEDMDTFKSDVAKLAGANPYLAPVPLGGSPESDVRKRFFEEHATGKYQMADPDGVWIDITDA